MRLASIFFISLSLCYSTNSALAAKDWQLSWVDKPFAPATMMVKDMNNKDVTLDLSQNKPILLNFWATWCPPCVKEMPSLLKLEQTYKKQNLQVIIVSEDGKGFEKITPFWQEKKLPETKASYFDKDSKLMQQLRIGGLPTTFLINAEGKIIGKIEGGAEWNSPSLKKMLEQKLLK